LTRWGAVRDLIVGWYGDDRSDGEAVPDLVDRLIGWMDPVQRLVVERLFAGWRAVFPKEPDVEVDTEQRSVSSFDHDHGVELRVSTTFGMSRPDGTTERVRLRTGRTRTGPDDAAVLHGGDEQGVVFLDGLVATGVAEEIVEPPERETRVAELVDLANREARVPLNPGQWCFSCSSAPRCGQYPLLGGGRVFNSTRSVIVSKTQLGWLHTCHRRIAWDRIHQIPTAEDGEFELRAGLATGLRFHETAAAAITSDDPDSVVESGCRQESPSEAAELRRLWDNHVRLWDEDGAPDARAVEYSAGVTFLVPGPHVDSKGRESTQPVAVTLIGVLDVTGREPDGTPMVIEHRTGRSGEHGHLEAELYAVSAAAAIARSTGVGPERLAVHLHHLRPDPPVCERRVFTAGDLAAAAEELRAAAETIAGWHPDKSLEPRFDVGPWCGGCRQRLMCESFR
jgi:hypothetical protein